MRTLRAARADLEANERRIMIIRNRLAELRALAQATRASHQQHVAAALQASERTIAAAVSGGVALENRGWDDPNWEGWQPRSQNAEIERTATTIRAAHLRDARSDRDLAAIAGCG